MMRFVPLLAFAGLAFALWVGLYRDDRDSLRSTFLDQPAPDFSIPMYRAEDEIFSLAAMAGEGPAVLNFWASWCRHRIRRRSLARNLRPLRRWPRDLQAHRTHRTGRL